LSTKLLPLMATMIEEAALAAARKSAEAMVKEQFRQMLRKMVTSS
jgi:hypothetical protein